jgi:hypothetical protein
MDHLFWLPDTSHYIRSPLLNRKQFGNIEIILLNEGAQQSLKVFTT